MAMPEMLAMAEAVDESMLDDIQYVSHWPHLCFHLAVTSTAGQIAVGLT